MRTVIDKDYKILRDDFLKIIHGDYTPEKVFCNKRNTVELVNVGHRKFVLKKYKRAGLLNGLIYTLFRKTKARRAYEYALILREKGIDTPRPVAYFEKKRSGIFRDGYFISEFVDMPTLDNDFYGDGFDSEEHQRVAADLSLFTLSLHEKGILPLDYNMTNIMYRKEGDHFRFALIDINRMKIGKVPGLKDSMRSFFQLGTYPADYHSLLGPYVTIRDIDFEEALYHIIRHRMNGRRLRRFKACMRSLLGN